MILAAHILAGVLALIFGYVALYATKGATLHRRSGMLFVYAMVTRSLSGALMEALSSRRISVDVVAGLVTFYFVTTALLTVRLRLLESQRIDAIAVLFGLTVVMLAFKCGFEMLNSGRPEMIPSSEPEVCRSASTRSPMAVPRPGWHIRCSCLVELDWSPALAIFG
ncbi:MAG: hypothetical protein H0W08_26510 [Acidobacteria bacterium]|nr:hypothetical protein [Acidobacteriota bacterium]